MGVEGKCVGRKMVWRVERKGEEEKKAEVIEMGDAWKDDEKLGKMLEGEMIRVPGNRNSKRVRFLEYMIKINANIVREREV